MDAINGRSVATGQRDRTSSYCICRPKMVGRRMSACKAICSRSRRAASHPIALGDPLHRRNGAIGAVTCPAAFRIGGGGSGPSFSKTPWTLRLNPGHSLRSFGFPKLAVRSCGLTERLREPNDRQGRADIGTSLPFPAASSRRPQPREAHQRSSTCQLPPQQERPVLSASRQNRPNG